MKSINRSRFCAIALNSAALNRSLFSQSSSSDTFFEGTYMSETTDTFGKTTLKVRTLADYRARKLTIIRDVIVIDPSCITVKCDSPEIESVPRDLVIEELQLEYGYEYRSARTTFMKAQEQQLSCQIDLSKRLQKLMMLSGYKSAN